MTFYPYQVLVIYYLIFVLCISLAISYALIMLFEVMYILKIASKNVCANLNINFSSRLLWCILRSWSITSLALESFPTPK